MSLSCSYLYIFLCIFLFYSAVQSTVQDNHSRSTLIVERDEPSPMKQQQSSSSSISQRPKRKSFKRGADEDDDDWDMEEEEQQQEQQDEEDDEESADEQLLPEEVQVTNARERLEYCSFEFVLQLTLVVM